MGVVETIDFDNFPKQKDDNYKYPSIGKRVRVCYKYDTSRCHEGVIVKEAGDRAVNIARLLYIGCKILNYFRRSVLDDFTEVL